MKIYCFQRKYFNQREFFTPLAPKCIKVPKGPLCITFSALRESCSAKLMLIIERVIDFAQGVPLLLLSSHLYVNESRDSNNKTRRGVIYLRNSS